MNIHQRVRQVLGIGLNEYRVLKRDILRRFPEAQIAVVEQAGKETVLVQKVPGPWMAGPILGERGFPVPAHRVLLILELGGDSYPAPADAQWHPLSGPRLVIEEATAPLTAEEIAKHDGEFKRVFELLK